MKPTRIRLCRKKGWRLPANAVSVARPSLFGNPFTGPQAVPLFAAWLAGTPASAGERFTFLTERRAKLLERLPELRGKSLACWCGPDDWCHADVLLNLANAEAS